jgi:hypothetical protein
MYAGTETRQEVFARKGCIARGTARFLDISLRLVIYKQDVSGALFAPSLSFSRPARAGLAPHYKRYFVLSHWTVLYQPNI